MQIGKNKPTVPSSILHTCLVLQYNDLMKKKRIVENDKAKILQTIEELDQKKNEALNLAWQKVCSLSYLVILYQVFKTH